MSDKAWCGVALRIQRRTVITTTLVRARGLEGTRRWLRGQQEAQGEEGGEGAREDGGGGAAGGARGSYSAHSKAGHGVWQCTDHYLATVSAVIPQHSV